MFTEHEYHKHRPRNVLFSEHVYFVQICPVFAGPVTFNVQILTENFLTIFHCIHAYSINLMIEIKYVHLN